MALGGAGGLPNGTAGAAGSTTGGAGGSTPLGTGGQAPSILAYHVTYPTYNSFLNAYGVWTNPDAVSPVGQWVSVDFKTTLTNTDRYTLRVSADDHIKVYINSNLVGTNDNWTYYNDYPVNLSAGPLTINCQALNDGGPASFAAALYTSAGVLVWSTVESSIKGHAATGFGAGGSGGSEDIYISTSLSRGGDGSPGYAAITWG
jgi:hypothetical protein